MNLLFIVADDMRYDELSYMPQTRRLARRGTRFTACRTNVPLCSPARVGIMSGQYSKYHAVLTNENNPSSTIYNNSLFVALDNAGYRVGCIGKFLTALSGSNVQPGFDFWRAIVGDGGSGYGIYEHDTYTIFDGTSTFAPGVYQETYLKGQATTFVGGTEPWCLWYCPTIPHFPFSSPSAHPSEYLGRDYPVVFETDVTDKPSWIQSKAALTTPNIDEIQIEERARLRELLSLDDTVAALAAAVPTNTTIIFTSDNGNVLGEHRLIGPTGALAGLKNLMYEPSMRVPLFAVGSNFAAQTVDVPVTHQDITAGMLDLGGTTSLLGNQAGVSLKTVAASPSSYTTRQLLHYRSDATDSLPADDAITTKTRKLIRHQGQTGTDQYEMYDLDTDPNELTNVANVSGRLTERNSLESSLNTLLA